MTRKSQPHASKVLDFLHGLYAWQDESSLVQWILDGLPNLVSGDNVMVGQHDPKTRMPLNVTIKHPTSRPNLLAEVCEAGMMENHPFWAPNPDPDDPVKILSAMMTRAEWERFPMYCELLREDKVRDHITVEFIDDDKLFYIAVARSSRGYSRQDQETLAALNPHFKQAFNSARIRRTSGFTSEFSCLSPVATHQVDQRGNLSIVRRDEQARWARLFGANAASVFENLKDWTRHQVDLLNRGTIDAAVVPFRVKQRMRVIEFRLHRRWGGPGYVLSQRIRVDVAVGPNSLTPREREVLRWVREGKENGEIAIILGLSRHTVKDHLKRTYAKLGVDNRTAAARMILPDS